ncbi:unnamed protein product [Arctia plantaginis]|uniref:Uncharacterized protein n=1 Tax=Arctia plantaginis TaxID=874455 RepID=A0A8S0ZLW5_ARCPL|nr:unnamed protein product [Arctia plantaginis]
MNVGINSSSIKKRKRIESNVKFRLITMRRVAHRVVLIGKGDLVHAFMPPADVRDFVLSARIEVWEVIALLEVNW